MIITIASGKGGTGKTTVATNLAVAIEDSVQLVDCDVEEPNAHLFFTYDQSNSNSISRKVPKFVDNGCIQCGACQEICQFSAIILAGNQIMTFPDMCHSCMGCIMVCPNKCLLPMDREMGNVTSINMDKIELIYGTLKVGEAMAPPLIEEVKKRFDFSKLIIVDAPPGTSCPVVTTLLDSDYIILVTEPTPFGLNDLKLAVETVRKLGIPFGIVINRSDIGDDCVEQYATDENIPILMRIKHQRELAEKYSQGKIISVTQPDIQKSFRNLFHSIKKNICSINQ